MGSPLPSFRLVETKVRKMLVILNLTLILSRNPVVSIYHVCSTGPSKPEFRLLVKLNMGIITLWYQIVDPIGGSKPKFSLETKSLTFVKDAKSSIALSCPAQGSPLPAFRLGKSVFYYLFVLL